MAPHKKPSRAQSRTLRTVKHAVRNAQKGGELVKASGEVIAKRLNLAVQSIANPLTADHGELARMVPEKVHAFTSAGMRLAVENLRAAARLNAAVAEEWSAATRATAAIVRASSPLAMMGHQRNFAFAWWQRSLSHLETAGAALMTAQSAVTGPIHRTAVANAKRLRG